MCIDDKKLFVLKYGIIGNIHVKLFLVLFWSQHNEILVYGVKIKYTLQMLVYVVHILHAYYVEQFMCLTTTYIFDHLVPQVAVYVIS